MKSIAVYLSSSVGNDPKYVNFARHFGAEMARKGVRVIYGGANVGCMAALADGVLSEGGQIVGVFPTGFGGKREVQAMNMDIERKDLTQLIHVKDFAERKAVMEEMSDLAVALPGGVGTMDEVFCYGVNNEIGLHSKQVVLLNIDGFYDGLKLQIDTMKKAEIVGKDSQIIQFCDSLDDFCTKFITFGDCTK